MPPATIGPAPSSEPPRPGTPLIVVYSRAVSKSQSSLPSAAANARKCPSTAPESTAPGIAVTAAAGRGIDAVRAPVERRRVRARAAPEIRHGRVDVPAVAREAPNDPAVDAA